MADDQQYDPRAVAWVEGFLNKYDEFSVVDDQGKRHIKPGYTGVFREAIEDVKLNDETLKALSKDEADTKLVSNPRHYHAKVRDEMRVKIERPGDKHPTLVDTIKSDQRKRGLYAY